MGINCSLPDPLPAEGVPVIFREPHVLHGYRHPHKSWTYYLRSFCQINNEVVNVWTHFLALLFAIYKFRHYADQLDNPWDPYYLPFFAAYPTVFCLYCASVLAHGFHSKSEIHHFVCFSVDYAGIGLYGVGIGVLHYYYSAEPAFYDWLHGLYPWVIAGVSAAVCWISSHLKVAYDRPYPPIRKILQIVSILVMYFWIIFPLLGRFRKCVRSYHGDSVVGSGFQNRTSIARAPGVGVQGTSSWLDCGDEVMVLHAREIAWFILAGFFYGTNTPHRFTNTGSFDFIGHGHQLFHVCISLTTVYGNEGVFMDMVGKRGIIESRILAKGVWGIVWPILVVLVIEIVGIYEYYNRALKKIAGPRLEGEKRE